MQLQDVASTNLIVRLKSYHNFELCDEMTDVISRKLRDDCKKNDRAKPTCPVKAIFRLSIVWIVSRRFPSHKLARQAQQIGTAAVK